MDMQKFLAAMNDTSKDPFKSGEVVKIKPERLNELAAQFNEFFGAELLSVGRKAGKVLSVGLSKSVVQYGKKVFSIPFGYLIKVL